MGYTRKKHADVLTVASDIQVSRWSPNGKYLVHSSNDNALYIWNIETKECVGKLSGHNNKVLCLSWHPNNKYVASGAAGEAICLWDIEKRIQIGSLVHCSCNDTITIGWNSVDNNEDDEEQIAFATYDGLRDTIDLYFYRGVFEHNFTIKQIALFFLLQEKLKNLKSDNCVAKF